MHCLHCLQLSPCLHLTYQDPKQNEQTLMLTKHSTIDRASLTGCVLVSAVQEYEHSLARQIAGFENVGLSMLSVFQAMTLTNWSFTMYRTMDFLSPAVVVYWFVMIVFGAYFVVSGYMSRSCHTAAAWYLPLCCWMP